MSDCLESRILTSKSWRTGLFFWVLGMALCVFSASAKELHIATVDLAPFGFRGADGKPAGILYEVSNLIAAEAGFTYTNEILPYPRTVHAVAHGSADIVVRYGNAELATAAIPVARVLSFPTIVVGKPSFKLTNLKDLSGKTVGKPRGGQFDDDFDMDAEILKFQVSDYSQMLKMLMAGRFEAGLGSCVGIYYTAHMLGLTPEHFGKPLVLNMQHVVVHFSKKTSNDETIAALRSAIARLEKRDAFNQIVNKYLSSFDWNLQPK